MSRLPPWTEPQIVITVLSRYTYYTENTSIYPQYNRVSQSTLRSLQYDPSHRKAGSFAAGWQSRCSAINSRRIIVTIPLLGRRFRVFFTDLSDLCRNNGTSVHKHLDHIVDFDGWTIIIVCFTYCM